MSNGDLFFVPKPFGESNNDFMSHAMKLFSSKKFVINKNRKNVFITLKCWD